jgi:hypothetical protein
VSIIDNKSKNQIDITYIFPPNDSADYLDVDHTRSTCREKVQDKALKRRDRVERGKELEFCRYPIFPPDMELAAVHDRRTFSPDIPIPECTRIFVDICVKDK